MKFGSLDFEPIADRGQLVADPVRAMATQVPDLLVAAIDTALSDTAAFCERYGIGLSHSANCVIVEARRTDRVWYAACVILATTRADINGAVRKHLEARKVSFAPMDQAVTMTGMEFGGITPVGLPEGLPVLVDTEVTKADYVVIGSGVRRSKLLVKPEILTQLPGAVTMDIAKS